MTFRLSASRMTNSGILFFVLFFTLLSLPSAIDAEWWNPLSWGEEITKFLTTVVVFVLTAIPAFIFFVVAGITTWFMGIVFSIPIVPGSTAGDPPIFVEHGWNLMRGLANMFFLLILVFIGLATILRWREYELQRTLPRLIIAALLVNFSAVLVGFIVDIANLVGNYFLKSVGGFGIGTFAQIFNLGWTYTSNLVDKTSLSLIEIFISGFVYGVVMFFFFLISAIAYLTVLIIFLLRTIVLWILVILSPLAFAAAVLPATRGLIWNRWWSSLLQWSFIVIPISFFLWLSLSAMTLDSQNLFSNPASTNIEGFPQDAPGGLAANLAQFLALIMGPIVGIVILLVGISISLATAPGSVRAVGNFARKSAIVGTGVVGGLAVNRFFSKQRRDEQETGTSLAQRLEQRNFGIDWKEHKLRSALITVGTGGFVPLARAGLRKGIKEGRQFEEKNSQEAIDKQANEHKGKSIEQINRELGGLMSGKDDIKHAGLLLGAIRGGHSIEDIQDKDRLRHGAEVLMRDAKSENFMEIAAANPSLLPTEEGNPGAGVAGIWGRERAPEMQQRILQAITPLTRGRLRTSIDPETGQERIADRDSRITAQELETEIAERQAGVRANGDEVPQDQRIRSMEDRDAFIQQRAALKKVARRLKDASYDQMDIRGLLRNPDHRAFLDEIIKTNDRFIKKLLQENDVEAAQAIQERVRSMGAETVARSEAGATTLAMAHSRSGQDRGMTDWNFTDATGAALTFTDPRTGNPTHIDDPNADDTENRRTMRRFIDAMRRPRTAATIAPTFAVTPGLGHGVVVGERQLRTQFGGGTAGTERLGAIRDELYRQLDTPQEQALIREYTTITGSTATAAQQRAIEIGELLDKQRREYPDFAPAPALTNQEDGRAREIAAGTRNAPQEETLNDLRLVAGAEIKAEHLMRSLDYQAGARRLHLEGLERQLTALPAGDPRIPGLTSQITTVRTEIGNLLAERHNAETRRDALETQRTALQALPHLRRA